MEYTQLDFVPIHLRQGSIVDQAALLLRELVADRHHDFPCFCGACIYWAYKREKKSEGRQYSKRTFFMYFLRADLFRVAIYESLPFDYSKWKSAARIKRADIQDNKRLRHEPGILGTNVYWDTIRHDARNRVVSMIRELERTRRSESARAFLRGFLNKRCFYEYYRRAEDEAISLIVRKVFQYLQDPANRSRS